MLKSLNCKLNFMRICGKDIYRKIVVIRGMFWNEFFGLSSWIGFTGSFCRFLVILKKSFKMVLIKLMVLEMEK